MSKVFDANASSYSSALIHHPHPAHQALAAARHSAVSSLWSTRTSVGGSSFTVFNTALTKALGYFPACLLTEPTPGKDPAIGRCVSCFGWLTPGHFNPNPLMSSWDTSSRVGLRIRRPPGTPKPYRHIWRSTRNILDIRLDKRDQANWIMRMFKNNTTTIGKLNLNELFAKRYEQPSEDFFLTDFFRCHVMLVQVEPTPSPGTRWTQQ